MADTDTQQGASVAAGEGDGLVTIRLPVWWTFGGLVAGLLTGLLLAGSSVIEPVLEVTRPVGSLWLRALQMTIIPLVAALLVLGITKMAQAARAGATARRMLLMVFALLVFSGVAAAICMPLLLQAFPPPAGAASILDAPAGEAQQVPTIGDFISSLIAPNIIQAAAETSTLPLTIFFALFAVAVSRLPEGQRLTMLRFFEALANAMLTIIGWVLWVAPVGVFALAVGVAARAGGGAFATLAHYIITVSAMGAIVLVAGYIVGIVGGRRSPAQFARAVLPSQAVAVSTQSSLASLPAMLASARRLGIREEVADFVLPLAVAIFRATSPAMNMAVAIYVAHLAGVELTPMLLIAGIAVAFVISVGSVSLPGSISFVISIGPIALAMGVPIEPLALLVAVEMLPDIMRTLANVTMNVGLTAAVDREKDTGLQP
ncbi:dicarboxylate/amino acid:cation symporter [Parerythrobacter jejuensis]|uniref:Cation:dicarboxylase symporter family transporter n=1 Tax=Parerythrobacter jejuensis TaxID=795812 RepID=A0A845AUB8_9SPHN|nr:cation:dicarboxylase symporter family transporter [Parerythrobacter jejuensis]MXP30428.1 cation:dicarboxylase symporter family transporter [Parerythrobacter jejuensis]MXP33188.1 cation:dicarboxylase symporter family transporter [Parerythrobacter jejuensis]